MKWCKIRLLEKRLISHIARFLELRVHPKERTRGNVTSCTWNKERKGKPRTGCGSAADGFHFDASKYKSLLINSI